MAARSMGWKFRAGWENVVVGGLEGGSLNDRKRLACDAWTALMKELFVLLPLWLLGLSPVLAPPQLFDL